MVLAGTVARQVAGVSHAEYSNPMTVTFNGATFVNHGLVGAGRLPSTLHDFRGDSLGSFSGLAVHGWHRNADGTYAGSLLTLPDRGYNAKEIYSDFAARIETLNMTFAPRADGANPPLSPDSQNALVLKPAGGIVLTDFAGHETTGANPAAGTITERNSPALACPGRSRPARSDGCRDSPSSPT